MMMTSPMSDEVDAKDDNDDIYESRKPMMFVTRLMNGVV